MLATSNWDMKLYKMPFVKKKNLLNLTKDVKGIYSEPQNIAKRKIQIKGKRYHFE